MKLGDLVDLEWLLAEPAHLPDGVIVAARPAAAAAASGGRGGVDADLRVRQGLCAALLAAARAAQPGLPGRAVERAVVGTGHGLTAIGLLAGGGTALAVLAYDGTTPVNVLHFVLVFFVLQLVLLALLAWFLARTRRDEASGPALTHRFVAWIVDRLLGPRRRDAAELLRVQRARHTLYAGVERWTLFALVQRFGVGFNVAAVAATLVLLTATDLVFAWSTTLLSADGTHAWAVTLSLPWAAWDAGVPSLATVEGSQWVRMPGGFVQTVTAAERELCNAAWWRFLVAGLLAYGLLPRAAALLLGIWLQRRALRTAGLDHAGFHAAYERLLPRDVGFAGPDPATVRGEPPAAARMRAATPHAPAQPGASGVVICWGSIARIADTVCATASSRLLLRVLATARAGGASLGDDGAALQQLARHGPQRALIVFAAGQQPTADALSFLRDVRKQLGPGKPVLVLLAGAANGALTDADPDEHAIWRRSLGTLGDAHLWLETLEDRR